MAKDKNSVLQNPGLTSLKFDLINNCNYRCSFCPYYGDGESRGRVISSEGIRMENMQAIDSGLLIKMFGELSEENLLPSIKISGWGEGLLHPDFDRITSEAHEKGFNVRMISNGYLTEHHLEAILGNLDTYVASIHGPPDIHNHLVKVQNASEKTMSGISKLLETSENIESSLSKLILTFTIDPENADYISEQALIVKDLREKSRKIPVKARFQHDYLPSGTYGQGEKTYNLDVLEKQLKNVRMIIPDAEIIPELKRDLLEAYYSKNTFVLNPYKCDRVAHELEIRSNGDVYTCISGTFGNLHEESILDILQGRKWKDFVEHIQKEAQSSKGLSSACDRCCYQAKYVLPLSKR